MKYLIFSLFLFGAISAQCQEKQSLKDLLYRGKLKKDSSGVIRSTDDLSAKIDTTTKKSHTTEVTIKETQLAKTSIAAVPVIRDTTYVVGVSGDTTSMVSVAPKEIIAPSKTNTRIWKEHIDSIVKILKSEVLTSKKIKKETYFVMIEHEIGTDGQVNVLNVTTTPENSLLQGQLKQILDSTPIRLNPVLDSTNQPKKVKRKQNFSITKD